MCKLLSARTIMNVKLLFSTELLSIPSLLDMLYSVTQWSMPHTFLVSQLHIWKFNRNSLTIEKSPDKTQTMSAIFTLPVCIKTPVGDTKMPDPMIEPTITVHPLSRLIFALRPTSPSPSAPFWLPSVGELPLLASNGKFSSREPLRFWFTSVFVIISERFAIQH